MAGPLEQLAEASGREFPNLLKARELTSKGLGERRARLADLSHDEDVSIVLMGSWGRSEVTSGSDDDFMLLVRGDMHKDVRPSKVEVETILDRAPGDQGIFGAPVSSRLIIENIGLEEDSNNNLSRRMLFLLESVCATGQDIYDAVRKELLDRYLDQSVKDFRPPRFLLNDVIRYWRTMCVDFAGKEHEGPRKWGLRNVKLRTARKVLFAGGLLPVFECAKMEKSQMTEFLRDQLQMPPVDRIAAAFLNHHAADPGGRSATRRSTPGMRRASAPDDPQAACAAKATATRAPHGQHDDEPHDAPP
ncbi:MAG TPA: hypothetical protein VGL54_04495, partial [Solirubrobacteraceae bacterium]